ncbi:hypothetical protein ACWCPM_00220 [Streptomyces sp. NPDC002309]
MLTGESGVAVSEHIAELTAQLARMVEAGVAVGAFTAADPRVTASAVFGTGRCHDPCHAPMGSGRVRRRLRCGDGTGGAGPAGLIPGVDQVLGSTVA